MSVHVMSWVWKQTPQVTNPVDRLVLLYLADSANDDGTSAYPSVDTIGRVCCVARRTVFDSLARLKEMGLIEAIGISPLRTTIYRIVMDKGGADSARVRSAAPNPEVRTTYESSTSNGLDAVSRTPPVREDAPSLDPGTYEALQILNKAAEERGLTLPRSWTIQKTIEDFPEKDAVQVAKDCRYWLTETEHGMKRTDVARTYRTFMNRAPDKQKKSTLELGREQLRRMFDERG